MMNTARWERMQDLFHEALDVKASRRRVFLEERCDGDSALVDDVLALLEADVRGDSLLDRDLAHMARDVLDASVPVPEAIGPYRVREVLGRGGMGTVYRAEREDLGNEVAIKVLRDASLSPARRRRFTREQRALAQLHHPAIAQIYDAAVLPGSGTPYFVMEYVEGVPLTAYCRAHRCALSERLRLFRAVCEAVQHAHRRAVIHRDLKPSNILVAERGPDGEPAVKLLDFGIATQLADLDTTAAPAPDALRLMTPAYAAPEQFRGAPVGVYTDVYALGLILYELLAGQPPFDVAGRSPDEVEALRLEQAPEAPSAKARRAAEKPFEADDAPGKQAWADLDALCLKALHEDPQRRYATVDALMRDLDRFRAGKPLAARPGTPGYRTGKFLRRHWQPALAAALAAAVLLGLTLFYTTRLADERDRAQAEAAKADQVSGYLIGLFEAGDPFTPEADSLTVSTLLERGVAQAEALSGQPAVQAQMFNTLGRVHMQLSQYDRADTLLRRALALRRGLEGAALGVAATLTNRAELYKMEGRSDSAEGYIREALALQEAHLPPRHPEVARALHILGSILNRRGQHAKAEARYRLALRIQRAVYDAPHEALAATLNDLAVCLFNQGRYDAAERYFREAIAVDRAVFGPDHPSTAIDLANFGVLRYARALRRRRLDAHRRARHQAPDAGHRPLRDGLRHVATRRNAAPQRRPRPCRAAPTRGAGRGGAHPKARPPQHRRHAQPPRPHAPGAGPL